MRLIQFLTTGQQRAVGLVRDSEHIDRLAGVSSTYELAQLAITAQRSLAEQLAVQPLAESVSYQQLIDEQRILPPFDHPQDPAHMLISGTGLTHLGSADTRATMHAQASGKADAKLTDTMRMFRLGLEGGKPAAGEMGVQPEWFYKGDGSIVVAPGAPLQSPAFALDGGEEPEIAGLYLIAQDGQPWRVGFAVANEFSDHVTERQNYLYLAHSKLRQCAFGPELLIGELPSHLAGYSRIWRQGELLWEKPFVSGEANMSHSIANLEAHHFKYALFCRPGDAHVHFFGTATLSFGDGVVTQAGDQFEIGIPEFGRPLRNTLQLQSQTIPKVKIL